MAASGSSSSSFTSSSLGIPPSYVQAYASPGDSTWTPSSAVSALTSESSAPPTPLRPLDLGPPGYQATITLFQQTANEITVYLGPWEVVGSEQRRVVWQCSYQGEVLEHFLPSDLPAQVFPFTLHAHHRPYGDPSDMELYLTFREPHRIRYTTADGVLHDDHIEVKYEFTSVESSIRFQGDLRRRDLVDWFDVDVVWSDTHGRTDSFGNVRGLGTIQRLKLWRDQYSTFHYLTFFANRTDRRFREYQANYFEGELRGRDDRHRRIRLSTRGRRGSAPDNQPRDRRFSISSPFRPRQQSVGHSSHAERGSSSSSSSHNAMDIRYLGIQFSRNDGNCPNPENLGCVTPARYPMLLPAQKETLLTKGATTDYRRFLEQWVLAHSSDSEFHGVPFPPSHVELPSPDVVGQIPELESPEAFRSLESVPEPPGSVESDETP